MFKLPNIIYWFYENLVPSVSTFEFKLNLILPWKFVSLCSRGKQSNFLFRYQMRISSNQHQIICFFGKRKRANILWQKCHHGKILQTWRKKTVRLGSDVDQSQPWPLSPGQLLLLVASYCTLSPNSKYSSYISLLLRIWIRKKFF